MAKAKPKPAQGFDLLPMQTPKNSTELERHFTAWLLDGGDDSRAAQAKRTGEFLSRAWPDDVTALLETQKTISSLLAWTNAQLADVGDFVRLAEGIFSEEALKDKSIMKLGTTHANRMIAMWSSPYLRAQKSLERLSATATHQLDGIRTQISTLRELARLDGSQAKG